MSNKHHFIDEFVLNKVSDVESFGVDLRNSEPYIIRFSNASHLFANSVNEGLTYNEIINKAKDHYSDIDTKRLEGDLGDFFNFLKDKNLLK